MEIVQILTLIVKKQIEISEKNKYCLNFNFLLKRYDRLVKRCCYVLFNVWSLWKLIIHVLKLIYDFQFLSEMTLMFHNARDKGTVNFCIKRCEFLFTIFSSAFWETCVSLHNGRPFGGSPLKPRYYFVVMFGGFWMGFNKDLPLKLWYNFVVMCWGFQMGIN